MIEYSLLVPTRERPYRLDKLFESIDLLTDNKNQVEILVAIDHDDEVSQHQLPILTKKYNQLIIKVFSRERSEFLNSDYYNFLGEKAEGNYLWINADDLVFLEKHWDTHILNEHLIPYLKDKPDRIMCAGIKDDTPKPKPSLPQFPCFPLVTKEARDFFGYILPPQIPTWGADYLVYLLYTQGGRYLTVHDRLYLAHIGIHTKTAPKDETAKRIERIFNQLKLNPLYNIDLNAERVIPQESEKLNKYLIQLRSK